MRYQIVTASRKAKRMTKNHRRHNCQGALCHKLLVEVFGLIGPLETEKYMIKSHFYQHY